MAFPSEVSGTYLGQANLTGDAYALFQKKFTGEILSVFRNQVFMRNIVGQFRSIAGADRALFNAVGTVSGERHLAHDNIMDATNGILQTIRLGDVEIRIDRPLMTAVMIDRLQEIMNHYDARAPFAESIGKFFAEKEDVEFMRLAIKASQGIQGAGGLSGVTSDHPSGSFVTAASALTNVSALLAGIQEASETMDTNLVPDDGRRYCFLKPAQYNLLADPASQLTDRDFGGEGNGVYANGTVLKAWGFKLIKTNLLPTDNSTSSGTGATSESVIGQNNTNSYVTNARKTAALCYHPMTLGALEAIPMAMNTIWKDDYEAHRITAIQATGKGVLRPEGAIVIRTGDPATA